MKLSHALRFDLGVLDVCRGNRLFRFEHRVYAFSGDYPLFLKVEDERRVLPVVDDYVDLVTEMALAIDDVAPVCLIPFRKVRLQEFEPYGLARVAFCAGMSERFARDREPT